MNKRFLLLVTIFVGIGLAVLYIFIMIGKKNNSKLIINTLPDDAQIIINDKPGNSGSNLLSQGKYTIVVSKDGFLSTTKTVELNTQQKNVNISLTPNSTEAEEWAQKNNKKYLEFEKIAGSELQKAGDELVTNNPVVKFLPFRMPDYDIEYRLSDDNKVIVVVYAGSSEFRTIAINTIKSWGVDPGDYQIDFINYNNPLTEGLGGE